MPKPENLDSADWEAFRAFAHEIVDAVIDRRRDIADGPVWRAIPGEVEARPAAPMVPATYAEIRRRIDELLPPRESGAAPVSFSSQGDYQFRVGPRAKARKKRPGRRR